MKFEIGISQLIAKIVLKQRSLNQLPDTFWKGTFKFDIIFYWSKNIKVFQWLSKSKFFSFMTKVNAKNENETKAAIFPWNIFKSDLIYILSNNKVFQWHSKSKFHSFMAKLNPNINWNKTRHFPGSIFKSDIIFHWSKNTKIFQWIS